MELPSHFLKVLAAPVSLDEVLRGALGRHKDALSDARSPRKFLRDAHGIAEINRKAIGTGLEAAKCGVGLQMKAEKWAQNYGDICSKYEETKYTSALLFII